MTLGQKYKAIIVEIREQAQRCIETAKPIKTPENKDGFVYELSPQDNLTLVLGGEKITDVDFFEGLIITAITVGPQDPDQMAA